MEEKERLGIYETRLRKDCSRKKDGGKKFGGRGLGKMAQGMSE